MISQNKLSKCFLKVCGNKDCCYTPWLTGNFNIGEIDSYTGPSQLGECSEFELMDDTMPLSMSKYHNYLDMLWNIPYLYQIGFSRYDSISSRN